MRFRLGEDERRYNALRVEAYLRLLALPPNVVSEILQNWSKIEAVLFWEGVKQGLSIATLHAMDGRSCDERLLNGAASPAQAHAAVYGEASTPLADVEAKQVASIFGSAEEARAAAMLHPWLAARPVEFPPQTLAEAVARYGADTLAVGAAEERQPAPARPQPPPEPIEPEHPADAEMMERLQALMDREQEEDRAVSPALIDRVRDELLSQVAQGWKPKDWYELIMRLHLSMAVDASALDLQLSSDMGRAVLAQVGLFDVFPGLGVMVDENGAFDGVKETL